MIARCKGFKTQKQIKAYLQTGSIKYNVRNPIILKELEDKFLWYSIMPMDRLETEEVTRMIAEEETLETVMQNLKARSGKETYIAIITFLPDHDLVKIGERHVMNLKFIQSLGYFIRIDSVEPFPQPIGLTDKPFFKSIQEADIYGCCLTDITKGKNQMNKAGVTAGKYYETTQNDMPKRFPKHEPKLKKSCLHRPVFQDPPSHPNSTKRCSDYWLKIEGDSIKAKGKKGGLKSNKGKHW